MTSAKVRIVRLGGVLAGLAVGLLLGFLLARSRRTDAPRPLPGERVAASNDVPVPRPPAEVEETARLREQLARRSAEVRALQSKVEELRNQSLRSRSPEQKLQVARELYDAFHQAVRTGNDGRFQAVLKRFNELDPDMAPFFVEKYRMTHADDYSHVALELALVSGGKDVAVLVHEILTSAVYGEDERMMILKYLDGVSADVPVGGRLVLSGPLLDEANRLSRSENAWERKGAAGLLGFSNSPTASGTLRRMAETDPDLETKAAAYRALGRTGDAGNVSYLKEAQQTWSRLGPDGKPLSGQAEIQKAIRAASRQLLIEVLKTPED